MKKLLMAIAIAALAFSGISFAREASPMHGDISKIKSFFKKFKAAPHNRVELLFLQQADSGSILPDNDKTGCYTLKLTNLHKSVLYFSDQPKRKAGRIDINAFVTMWKHDKTKPNVALQAFVVNDNDVKEMSTVAELSNPNYDAKRQTMTYTACPIASSVIVAHHNLRSLNLFIDPFHQWPP